MRYAVVLIVVLLVSFNPGCRVQRDEPPPAKATDVPKAVCTDEALRAAALQGVLAPVKSCLASPVDVNAGNAEGLTPLMLAAAKGHRDIVLLLLEKKADPRAKTRKDGATALMFAAYYGRLDTAKALVENGVPVTDRDSGGLTAIDYCVNAMGAPPERRQQRYDTAEYLKAHEGQISERNLGSAVDLILAQAPELDTLIKQAEAEK